ncbi:type I glyceraldehyde-3-phosphate dehydrogenase [Candidatus Dependentiae bacterium]
MKKRIAINGFGRIGKTFLRTLFMNSTTDEIEVVAINIGPENTKQVPLLFEYDSVMGKFPGTVSSSNTNLIVNNHKIELLSEIDPLKLPWKKLKIDWVVEASGKFNSKQEATKHLKAGCSKVLITAPAKDADFTIIPGINDVNYNSQNHVIISLGSCTTNCFAPIIKVLKEEFELIGGLMTTMHSYTNDQVLLDIEHKDPRRARAAAINMIPTHTGADKVIKQIYPEFQKTLQACAIRVPIPIVSLIDFTFTTKENLTVEKINDAFKDASENKLKGILEFCTKPLVSSDFQGNKHSCIIDSSLTKSIGNLSKIFGWYDNEYGYCCRLTDFLLHKR